MDRRSLLKLTGSTAAFGCFSSLALGQTAIEPQPFSEDWLDANARELAAKSFNAPERRLDDSLASISYRQYRDLIKYKPENATWREDNLAFRLGQFQTAGTYYAFPVNIFVVDAGRAAKIAYSPQLFSFGAPVKAPPASSQSGFAGFDARAQINDPTVFDQFLVFLGGSFFRAVASGQAFGASARGLAVNTGQGGGEEFPLFSSFWIERPKPGDRSLVVHALLDSVSCTGRYRFVATPGRDTVIETEAVIYPRKKIAYAGIAPITSMFFFGPDFPARRRDVRARVHDSETLVMLSGGGEWIARPLINPERLQFSVFTDKNPKGFGFAQQARQFSDYQDLAAAYETRPSLWIEPIGDWGEGSIDLIELPAQDEPHDNVTCFWRPKDGLSPGIGHRFQYRMHWCWETPVKSGKATVLQTRVGETLAGDASFVVDFAVPAVTAEGTHGITAALTASSGEVKEQELRPNPKLGGYRLSFNYIPPGSQTADLRAILMADGKPTSETWIYRWAR